MVRTAQANYTCVIERGGIQRLPEFISTGSGKRFVVTGEDIWKLYGPSLQKQLWGHSEVLFLPPGEVNKCLASVEALAEQMVHRGADRSSSVIGFGGGIVTDVSGFLAAIFMRGVPVIQIPTTLLAQVDAAVGGKTGVNLASGKNLLGAFHQPVGVIIDPDFIDTLSDREYRAGLFEVIKCGIIRDPELFKLLDEKVDDVLRRTPSIVDELISTAVRIKCEVVSADERESDLRKILNFGHTVGHAIEAETHYSLLLHGEAIAWGMLAATRIAEILGYLRAPDADAIRRLICRFGPVPPVKHLDPDRLIEKCGSDKKTVQGKLHFVLPTEIGSVTVVSGIDAGIIRQALVETLQ